ncbi:ABC transporter ATP-binding protein [Pseudodesulfovibrio methanolicus]|uniref:ABC transporter ATP-binding protein n=1 Tax=Pseudodesulfovibrio methanolicus TaxID=3126690 RepID=A0ABZ2IYL0_9BACT
MTILSINNLRKSFGSNLVTNDVCVDFKEGELVSIIGPNGAGKTTFFNLLTGMIKPDAGKVLYKGQDITGLPPYKTLTYGLSRSFQVVSLFEEMNVLENVAIGVQSDLGLRGNLFKNFKTNRQIREKSEFILDMVGLLEKRDFPVGAISHGDRKILDIGMALSRRPETLLLDEPMSGLAKNERFRITDLIEKLRKSMTLIVVEHDMDVVFKISEKILVLHQGGVLAFDTPDAVANNEKVQSVYLKG